MSRRNWFLAGLAGAAALAGSAAGVMAQAPAAAPPAVTVPPPAATAPAAAVKPPAVVNGEVVTKVELDDAIKQVGGPNAVQMTDDQRRGQEMQVLGVLIDDKLTRQFLAKNAARPTPADVDARVAQITAELKEKQNKTLADYLKESNQTEATFRGDCAMLVQWEGYAKAKVTDADVQKYYTDNKEFFDRVMVRASHIVLRLPPNATEADKAKTRQQLADLRAQIVANKVDFADAAKKYSQCPTAPGGGDLGYIPRKFMVDDSFAQAAFSTPVNGVSEVVQSSYGLHLIKVTDRKAGVPSDFAKIKDDVRQVCTEEMRMKLLEDLRKSAKIEITLP